MNPLQTIPNLPPAISLDGSEQVWINQAGVDRRTTVGALAAGAAQAGYLPLTGGTITGNLTILGTMTGGGHIYAPTPPPGDNSTALATTAFVDAAIASALTGYLPLTGGTLTGNLAIEGTNTVTGFGFSMTPLAGDNSTKVATTAFVTAAIAAGGGGGGTGYLPLTGGTLTGPLGISAAGSSYLAISDAAGTTRQVSYETAGIPRWTLTTIGSPESGSNAGSDFAIYRYADNGASLGIVFSINRAAGSAAFSGNLNVQGNVQIAGTASGTTPVPGDNSTALATTAFVDAAIATSLPGSNTLPLMDGTAAAGTATAWSRGDHVHPSDTSRAAASALANYLPLSGGTVSGNLTVTGVTALNGVSTAPTPAAADSSTNIATTAFVHNVLGAGPYLPLSGGTLTGVLNITASAGSVIASPPAGNSSIIILNKPASGLYNIIRGSTNLARKWELVLGNADAETGGAAGSNLSLNAYDDANNALGAYFSITRSNGVALFQASSAAVSINTVGGSSQIISNSAPGNYKGVNFQVNGGMRWGMGCNGDAESGGNAGSNFYIFNYSDTSVALQTPIFITRSSGLVTMNTGLHIAGGALNVDNAATFSSTVSMTNNGIHYAGGNGIAFTWGPSGNSAGWLGTQIDSNAAMSVLLSDAASGHTSCYNFAGLAGPQCAAWYSGGNFVWNVGFSDRRLKSNIKQASKDALEAVKRLKVWELDLKPPHKDSPSQHWNWSLIADEVGDVIPSAFVPGRDEEEFGRIHDTLRELPLIAALVRAVQQLTERLEVVEGKVAA